jgi:hypothetical protein
MPNGLSMEFFFFYNGLSLDAGTTVGESPVQCSESLVQLACVHCVWMLKSQAICMVGYQYNKAGYQDNSIHCQAHEVSIAYIHTLFSFILKYEIYMKIFIFYAKIGQP